MPASPVRSCCSRPFAYVQPWPSSPMRFSTGTLTSVMCTMLTVWLPPSVMIGFTSTPGCFIGNSRNVMPSWRLPVSCGAREAEDPVGDVRGGGPDLRAVDGVRLAVGGELGLGLQRREVGTRARFGITLTPVHFARADVGQETLLLFLRAVTHQDRREHADAERHVERQHRGRGFLFPDVVLRRRPTRAAEFLRPLRHVPAAFCGGFREPADRATRV